MAKFKESDNRNLEAFKIDHRKYKNTFKRVPYAD